MRFSLALDTQGYCIHVNVTHDPDATVATQLGAAGFVRGESAGVYTGPLTAANLGLVQVLCLGPR